MAVQAARRVARRFDVTALLSSVALVLLAVARIDACGLGRPQTRFPRLGPASFLQLRGGGSGDAARRIADIEAEIARTQKNKATMSHLCQLKARLAQLKRALPEAPKPDADADASDPGEDAANEEEEDDVTVPPVGEADGVYVAEGGKRRMSALDLQVQARALRATTVGMRVANIYDLGPKSILLKMAAAAAWRPDGDGGSGGGDDDDGGGADGAAGPVVASAALQGDDGARRTLLVVESGVRIHTSRFERDKGLRPSNFAAKLRKHLRGQRLQDARALGADRVMQLTFGRGNRRAPRPEPPSAPCSAAVRPCGLHRAAPRARPPHDRRRRAAAAPRCSSSNSTPAATSCLPHLPLNPNPNPNPNPIRSPLRGHELLWAQILTDAALSILSLLRPYTAPTGQQVRPPPRPKPLSRFDARSSGLRLTVGRRAAPTAQVRVRCAYPAAASRVPARVDAARLEALLADAAAAAAAERAGAGAAGPNSKARRRMQLGRLLADGAQQARPPPPLWCSMLRSRPAVAREHASLLLLLPLPLPLPLSPTLPLPLPPSQQTCDAGRGARRRRS